MIYDFLSKIHLNIYNELANGHLRPFLPENSKLSNLKYLVRNANKTTILRNVDKKNVRQLLDEMDLTIYGFRSMDDIILDITEGPNGKVDEVTIKPRNEYKLNEFIDIPPAPDQKSAMFLILMADEFERIKIRSNKVLETTTSDRKLSLYANKHIQKAKQIAHDARFLVATLHDKGQFITDDADVYILFVLNLFLIRLIVYYRKFFKPFVDAEDETEEEMRLDFYHSLPIHKKYPYIFTHLPSQDKKTGSNHLSGIQEKQKKSKSVLPDVFTASTPAGHANSTETFSEKKSKQENQGFQSFEKFPINGQVNILTDVFLTLTTKSYMGGPPLIPMDAAQLKDFLMRNFLDKNGEELNSSTIYTLLKPYKTDKRPKVGSPKRLDLSEFYGE